MKKSILYSAMAAAVLAGSVSCEKTPGGGSGKLPVDQDKLYVVASKVGDASYLITSPSLDSGEISARGNGAEVLNATYWVFKEDEYVFALVYNNGSASTGASYYVDQYGDAREKYTYEFKRITTYGTWGDKIITVSTGNSSETDEHGNIAQALLFNYLNANDGSQSEGTLISENFLGNGEKVSLSGIVDASGKLYTSVVPMGMSKYGIAKWPEFADQDKIATADGGSGSGSYEAGTIPSTQYPDSAYVAIYSGDSFSEKPVIARTGKIGFASGRMKSQYYQTIWAADNGDVYVFSPGYGRTFVSTDELVKTTGTLPSGVMRIKAGETDFDDTYYVNLEEKTSGKPMFRCWHIDEDYFLLQLYKDGVEGMMQGSSANVAELAVFKASEGTVIPVTGLPSDLTAFGGNPYGEDGKAYMAIMVSGGDKPAFYAIDAATGVATKGLTVDAETVQTAGILKVRK